MSIPSFYEITVGDDYSIYDGQGVRDPEETNLPVSLDGRGFLVDMSDDLGYYHRYQRTSVNLTNTQQANNGGDQAQIPAEVFRRVTESWEAGAGQDRYDRDNSLPLRFRDSYRVDVFQPWKLSLLHDTQPVNALEDGRVFLNVVGQYLVAAVGTHQYWWTDLTSAPTVVFSGLPIVGACTDGQNLYILDNAGFMEKWLNPSTHQSWGVLTGADSSRPLLAYVKGFLISAEGNTLVDVSSGTGPATIYQHPMTDFWWRSACDGLQAAYLVGGMGDRWSVLGMTVKTDGTTFDPPTVAAPLPDGQVAYTVASYLGFLLVGLSGGWVFGGTDASGKLTYGRLTPTQGPVWCFEGQDRFVWYGSNGFPNGTTAGLGRMDLATFTNLLTPAYADDLSTSVTSGVVTDVVTFTGKRVFAIDGDGLWAESDTLAPDGWLTQGDISYNTSDIKQGLYADVHHEPLHGTIDVQVSYDNGMFGLIGTNTNGQSSTMGHLPIVNPFTRVELKYVLTRDGDDITQGPVLSRVEVRAIPVSGRATEWRLPIIITDDIGWDDGSQMRDVDADYDLLLDLFTTKRPVRFREAGRLYTVYCTDFLFLGKKYTNQGSSIVGTYICIIREIQ